MLMNAVIYARYSSDRQREESIEGQLRECTEYANKNNLTLIGSYVDRALSARTDDRPDFQRMIADSAKGLFEVVLVWKLDRFSRDRYDSTHYKHILKKNGVRLISAKENISDGPEGIILESMLEGYAEYYSAELSQKIRRGQQDNARKCMNNGGNIPLGYYVDKATGRLAVNPETAPYVQELFRRYANGERLSCLQAEMKKQGLRSKRGNAYSVGVLSNLLKNRKYIGEYKYGKVIIPDGIPGIIDKELFERVQMRMAANKKAPARAKAEEEYLLTTKLFCGQCGRLMAGESGRGCKGIVYHYYKCSGAKRKLGCKKKAIRKNWIEDVVVKYTATQVLTDTVISRIVHKHCNRIRVLFDRLLHTRHFHSKRNSEFWIHFRIHINRNCSAKHQCIDGTFMYISRQNDLVPCLTDRQDHALHCRCGSSYHKECMRCAKSICCKLLRFSDHRNRVAEIVQRLHRINIQPHTFLSQQLCKLRISSSSFMSRHIKGNDSLLSETFQCFIYGRMLLSFIIHLTCSSFPVVMYRQIQFHHSAIVYCLKTGTMIQLFLYIFKSNACEIWRTIP